MMTAWMSPGWLISMQRKAALGYMGEQVRDLQRDGYHVEADQLLDEMIARRESWNRDVMTETTD